MINKKFHHYEKLETFLEKKFSASPDDTTYTYGGSGKIYEGVPDISWKSIVFIKDVGFIGTHGTLYDASGESNRLKNPVYINGTEFDGSTDIVTNSWGELRNISISDSKGVHESNPQIIDGSHDIVLKLPESIDAKVLMDSEGRVIKHTYATKKELKDSIDNISSTTFIVYSGDDETYPTLENEPAVSWDTPELKNLHAGDYFVTSEGRIFQFGEFTTGEWSWREISDYYLYECLNLKSRLDSLESEVEASFEEINNSLGGGGSSSGGNTPGSGGSSSTTVISSVGNLKYVRKTMPYDAKPGYMYRYDKGIRLPYGHSGTVVDMSKLFSKINPQDVSVNAASFPYDPETKTVTYNADNVDRGVIVDFSRDKKNGPGGHHLFMCVNSEGAIEICGCFRENTQIYDSPSATEIYDYISEGKVPLGGMRIEFQKKKKFARKIDGSRKISKNKWVWIGKRTGHKPRSSFPKPELNHNWFVRARFNTGRYTSPWGYYSFSSNIDRVKKLE